MPMIMTIRFPLPKEAVISQMIVDIGDHDVENNTLIKSLSAMLRKSIDNLWIAASVSILGIGHRHCEQERDTDTTIAVEAS